MVLPFIPIFQDSYQRHGLEGLQQRFHNIRKFYTSISHPVSNEKARHAWVQRRNFDIGTPRWLEKAVLGAIVVNRVQKNTKISSLKGASLTPFAPVG